jgi:hypothetical protein
MRCCQISSRVSEVSACRSDDGSEIVSIVSASDNVGARKARNPPRGVKALPVVV